MKNKIFSCLLVVLAIVSCKDSNIDEPITELDNEVSQVRNDRIKILNQSITISKVNTSPGTANSGDTRMGTIEASPSFNCSESIDEDFTGNKKVDNKKTVCLAEGISFTGSIELKGGTFVIHGDAVINAINGNKGEIVITETGSLTMQSLNINNNFEITNYGDNFNVNSVIVSGDFENHGTISLTSFTVNGSGEFENRGTLTVSQNFDNNKKVKNKGTILVKGNLTINGSGEFDNECKLVVEGNLNNNKNLKNKSYVEVQKTTTINGGGKVTFEPQAYLVTKDFVLNGTLEGSEKNYSRVDVNGNSTINGGGKVRKKLDFNDFDGIEVNRGSFDNTVTINQSLSITVTDCNPGPYVAPLNPEYTLVADIAVPVLDGSVLSATDVTYGNGFAFISYHLNGPRFGGAVDVLNLTSINAPTFSMNFEDPNREFNGVALEGSKLYLAGQRSTDESKFTSNHTKGAVLYSLNLNDQNLLASLENWNEIPMPSFSGNSVEFLSSRQVLFASGASGGGFYIVDPISKTISTSFDIDFAKYFTFDGNVFAGLAGGPGEAKLVLSNTVIPLGSSALPVDGKNVVVLDENRAYVTLGQNGLVVVNTQTGKVISRYKPEKPGLTNGVAVDDNFVYLANGESGLLLLRKENLEFYGQYKYNGSANLVEVVDNTILIANGTGGVKLLIRTN